MLSWGLELVGLRLKSRFECLSCPLFTFPHSAVSFRFHCLLPAFLLLLSLSLSCSSPKQLIRLLFLLFRWHYLRKLLVSYSAPSAALWYSFPFYLPIHKSESLWHPSLLPPYSIMCPPLLLSLSGFILLLSSLAFSYSPSRLSIWVLSGYAFIWHPSISLSLPCSLPLLEAINEVSYWYSLLNRLAT